MRSRTAIGAALAALAALAASAALVAGPSAATTGDAAAGAVDHARAKTERVKVADDFFSPTELKVKPKTKIKWKWDPSNLDTHNVVLKKGPKGVKKKDFRSASGSIGVKFARKFKQKGTYDFICTFHKSVMQMTVKVKKR